MWCISLSNAENRAAFIVPHKQTIVHRAGENVDCSAPPFSTSRLTKEGVFKQNLSPILDFTQHTVMIKWDSCTTWPDCTMTKRKRREKREARWRRYYGATRIYFICFALNSQLDVAQVSVVGDPFILDMISMKSKSNNPFAWMLCTGRRCRFDTGSGIMGRMGHIGLIKSNSISGSQS